MNKEKKEKKLVAYVLEQALGANAEGDVIQCEEEFGDKLVETGMAREATSEDQSGGDAEEEVTEEEDNPEAMTDAVRRLATHAEDVTTKAVEQVAEKLVKASVKRPVHIHAAGSDEASTGGFKSLGEFAHTVMAKDRGNFSALTRLDRARKHVAKGWETKATGMSVTGGSGHQGGDLVPQQWATELWKLSFDSVPDLLGMCNQYPMQNQVMNIPAWVQASAATGLVAGVAGEAGTMTATVGVTANVQLSLNKFYVFVNTSDELERFNGYALDSVLKQVAPQRIRFLVNDSIVNGTNNGVNLVANAATVVKTRATNNRITYPDILAMYAALWGDFTGGACWLINQSTIPEIYSMTIGTSQYPAFTPGAFGSEQLLGPKPEGLLLGLPVYKLENVPALGAKGDIVLYNPKSIAAGQTGLIADSTPFLYFNLAQNSYRFMWYADTVNPLTSVYTRADSSTASNIVVLSQST